MSRPPKAFDSSTVHAFLAPYFRTLELLEDYPRLDDILSGVLAAKTYGDTATRTLSRKTLFRILCHCPVIDTASVVMVTGCRSQRTAQAYASLARCASLFIARFIDSLQTDERPGELPQPL